MNKLKIFFLTFAICIMSVGFSFADSPNSRSIYEAPNGNKYNYKVVYNLGSTVFTVFCDTEPTVSGSNINFSTTAYLFRSDGFENILSGGGSLTHYGDYEIKGPLVSPPQIAPTIQGAVKGIVPALSSQLSKFLPTALIMFASLLSVPLIPRVIRYFF